MPRQRPHIAKASDTRSSFFDCSTMIAHFAVEHSTHAHSPLGPCSERRWEELPPLTGRRQRCCVLHRFVPQAGALVVCEAGYCTCCFRCPARGAADVNLLQAIDSSKLLFPMKGTLVRRRSSSNVARLNLCGVALCHRRRVENFTEPPQATAVVRAIYCVRDLRQNMVCTVL